MDLPSDVRFPGLAERQLRISSHARPACFLLPTFKPDPAAIERMRLQHLYLISHPDIAAIGSAQLFETDAAFHENVR